MKILYTFCLVLSIASLHCGDNHNWALGNSNVSSHSYNRSLIFETWIKFYNFLFRKKSLNIYVNADVRNEPEENSLTKLFKIDQNQALLNNYLNYFCSNLSIAKFDGNTRKYTVEDSKEGARLTRNLSLFAHPDRFTHADKIQEQKLQETAKTFFQILTAQEKHVEVPLESKSFYIRCFFELLNKHTKVADFEEDLKQIHDIAIKHRFSLENFSNLSIDQIIQKKHTLDELYKNSWKFKVNQIVEFTIAIGLVRSFCETLGSKLARNFIPHLKQAKDDIYYQQACEHYNVNAIKNPKKRAYMEDQLKTEYNQYSPNDFLLKAIKAAGPYLNRNELKKNLHYF